MNTNQREVLKWWHSGRDYIQGVMLLSKFSKRRNNVLAQTLMKPGKEKFQKNHVKLHYELPKAVGLNWKNVPPLPPSMQDTGDVLPKTKKQHTEPAQTAPEPDDSSAVWFRVPPAKAAQTAPEPGGVDDYKQAPIVSDKPIGDYPKIIRRLKYEYSNLYTDRSLRHKQIRNMPEKNTAELTQNRSVLLAEMKEISAKMDALYVFIENYEKKGVIPLEEEVWPKPKKEEDELPDDADALKKRKKNLQSANTKDRNQLLYQQNQKAKKANPMPEGPKRKKFELRIKERAREIETIEMKLLDVSEK